MNLASVDLNLLVAFEALLIDRNVSRAANRVGLSQPALSNALSRLRMLFSDELFVRTPHEMRPTPRALELARPVCDALEQLRFAFDRSSTFSPGSTKRLFRIGGSDNADFAIAPAFAKIRRAAPNVDFEVVALTRAAAISLIDEGALDLSVGAVGKLPKRFFTAGLYPDRYMCIANRQHGEMAKGLTLESFVAMPHVRVASDTYGQVDDALAARGLSRRIVIVVPNFAAVPYVIEHSDLLAVVGERIALRFAALPWITIHDLPIPVDPWTICAIWSRRGSNDVAITWLRTRLQEACASL